MMARKTTGVSYWALQDERPEAVAKRISRLPESIRPWVGRMVWWDRYAERTEPVNGFEQWLNSWGDPEPDLHDLAQALIKLGYTERYAGMRAGITEWGVVRQRRSRHVSRPAPIGTVFPVRFSDRVTVWEISNQTGWVGYEVRVSRLKTGKGARRKSADYFAACDHALDWVKMLEEAK